MKLKTARMEGQTLQAMEKEAISNIHNIMSELWKMDSSIVLL